MDRLLSRIADPEDRPRAVTDADFPVDAPPEAQLTALLHWAVQAPSVLNTQPWHVVVRGPGPDDSPHVALYVDRGRVLTHIDPLGREAVVSCGAALFTLRVAARHFGFATHVEYPGPLADPDLVATFHLMGPSRATPGEEALFRAIRHRHTNRGPYADLAVPVGMLARLRAAADAEGARLHVRTGPAEKAALAALIDEAIVEQGRDPATVAELRGWLRPTGDRRADGVPDDVQGPWDRLSYLHTDPRFLAAEAARLAQAAPALLVLATDRDDPASWTRAGQALQHVLLLAETEGLAASYFNQPVEVARLRPAVSSCAGPGHAQTLFRIGTPIEARGTPRRRVADVIRPDVA